jgi:hypothetical protein
MSEKWGAGDQPWLRRHQPEATYNPVPASELLQCLFCGARTLKRSASDRPEDSNRLELYCDNSRCDAREMVLLVLRDKQPGLRADVKALRLVDDGTLDVHKAFPPEVKSDDLFDLLEDRPNIVGRRMRKTSTDG